jgi:periplasmic protein TonB
VTRGLGTALALSIVAHGGAVATVGVLGVAWLGGTPPIPPRPALFVDLVQAVVATSDRIGAANAAALRPRSVPAVSRGARPAAPLPRARQDVVPSGDAPAVAADERAVATEGPRSIAPDVPRPPVAPVLIEPRPQRAASTPEGLAGPPPAPVAPPASSTFGPTSSAKPEIASVPPVVAAPSVPEPPTSGSAVGGAASNSIGAGLAASVGTPILSRPSPSPDTGQPTSPTAAGGSAVQPGAQPASGVPGAGSHRPMDVARLVPGEGGIPPEYEAYVRALRQRVEGRLVYPWMAARRGQQGVVELEVRVSSEGRLVGVEVVAGSTADALRTAAVAAVRGAAPFPFPPGVEARPLVIRLPVEFRLR